MIAQANALLGRSQIHVDGKKHRADCSGFVTGVYSGIDLDLIEPGTRGVSGTHILFRSLGGRDRIVGKRIKPGDLLFFHNTHDRNGNRVRDDRFTHVGLATGVDADGTVTMVHFASGKVKRDVLNLKHPSVAKDPATGKPWNSYLRRGRGKVLSGQLFFKAGRPLPR